MNSYERHLALTNHMFLGTIVMGMDFQHVPHDGLFRRFIQKDENQKSALYDLSPKIKRRMILWPRGTFKTSAIIVEIVQFIINFPNIRICFLTGGDLLAKRQLGRVKKVFESPTPKFKELFPEFCISKGMRKQLGNAHEFTVPCRTLDVFAEPTMAITTAKSVKAGSHYDIIFVDDLVNETNYQNPKLLEKCIQQYKDTVPLLAPDGYIYVTGTRYSFGDLYEEIKTKAVAETKETGASVWEMSILPCYVKYCANCEKWCTMRNIDHNWHENAVEPGCSRCKCKGWIDSGITDVLFPKFRTQDGRTEGWTMEKLDAIKRELGDATFACQYMNDPLPAGMQTFTPELLAKQTLWHVSQMPSAMDGPTFFVGDLSYVGSDDRDKSVIFVCRYYAGQIFVIDCISGKWDCVGVAANLLEGIMKYRPVKIWLEAFLGWEAYGTVIDGYARDKGLQKFPVEWIPLKYTKNHKLIQMGAVKVPLEQRRLWLNGAMPGYDTLCDDLKRWPKLGKHDDYGDCLGLVIAVPTGYNLEALPQPGFTKKSWLEKLNSPQTIDSGYDSRISGTY